MKSFTSAVSVIALSTSVSATNLDTDSKFEFHVNDSTETSAKEIAHFTALMTSRLTEKLLNGEEYFNPLVEASFHLSYSENNYTYRPNCVVAEDTNGIVTISIDMLKTKYGFEFDWELDVLAYAKQVRLGRTGTRDLLSFERTEEKVILNLTKAEYGLYCPDGAYNFIF